MIKSRDKAHLRRKSREHAHEEVEYQPRSVRELLTEMKDISELITDLAYSALILDSREMAEEVRMLEARMDKLSYQIMLNALVASRSMEDAESLTGILKVASAAEMISNAAGDIVDLLDEEIDKRPFLPFVLRDADEKFNVTRLDPESKLVGKTIGGSQIETRTGAIVIAVNRRSGWIFNPEKDLKLKGNDLLIVRGTEDGYIELQKLSREISTTKTSRKGGAHER